MNQFQQTLYNDLMKLCENEAFYYVDQKVDGKVFRVFTYRLASYTEFCLPNALECRGHTFLMDGDVAVDLVSLPPAKFFNYHELLPNINTIDEKMKRASIAYENGQLSEDLYRDLQKRYKK